MKEILSSDLTNLMATGFPVAIGLVDESVTFLFEFTREFAAEVDTRIIDSYDENLEEVKDFKSEFS